MSNYAIIQLSGKQFKVTEGDEFITDKVDHEEGETFSADGVLALRTEDELQLGQPLLEDTKVELEVLKQQRSKKLRVAKFKAKSRYRRVKGHRQHQSVVKVTSIK